MKFSSPPPGAEAGLGRLLWRDPKPLIAPQENLIILWSEKSACTQTKIWFLQRLGLLRAARSFHAWPHEYFQHVYYSSELYRKAYRSDLTAFKVIRIVRDPYERAVSSFRHMLGLGFGQDSLANRLRYRNIAKTGLSFEAFLDHLEYSALTRCNVHYRIQRHPIEDVLPVHHGINVSRGDLIERLNEFAGAPPGDEDQAASDWLAELRWHQRPEQVMAEDGADLYAKPLMPEQARQGPWPLYNRLLTPAARQRIRRLYAVDFESYFPGL